MLFNSYEFIFGFLPIVVVAFFLISRWSFAAAAAWLAAASLFFYGWWSIKAVPLLIASVCVNYAFGMLLTNEHIEPRKRRVILCIALLCNLALLGFFKYANFFIGNANVVFAAMNVPRVSSLDILLPIGISFYTFTQIAFLVDCWQGKVKERRFVHYVLFVTYFPHLIAGPVLHHAQMMPQFAQRKIYRPNYDTIAMGLAIFILGLTKKLLIADPLGNFADIFFRSVGEGTTPMLVLSWVGILAYTFQIYFDFSGYSDMAIGLSLLFGIRLPINFNSPYKATSIIDFWRRWHISLSTFLRDYLYVPLGGNKLGRLRRYENLLITMVLGGLWHGSNWTFVLWGAAHGAFLTVNHAWRKWKAKEPASTGPRKVAAWLLTFVCVCFAWVLFRSPDLGVAAEVYRGMLGINGIAVPQSAEPLLSRLAATGYFKFSGAFQGIAGSPGFTLLVLAIAFSICLAGKNLNACSGRDYIRSHRLAFAHAFAVGALFCLCLLDLARNKSPQFLYFQF